MKTQKTTSIIYASKHRTPLPEPMFCGEALFGSQRKNFVLDLNSGNVAVGITAKQWADIGCNVSGGLTLIDLR